MRSLSLALSHLTASREEFALATKSALRVGSSVYKTGGRITRVYSPESGEIAIVCAHPSGDVTYQCTPNGTVQFYRTE